MLRMIQMANDINLKHFVAMKIPTNIMSLQWDGKYGNPDSGCGETYYLDQAMFEDNVLTREKIIETKKKVELYINTEVDWVQAREYMALTDDQKDRIDLAITGLHLGDPRAHFSFFQKMADNDAPFSLVGEVTLAKEMVMHLLPHESQADLKRHIKPFCTLIEMVGLTGLPMNIHCDMDTAIPDEVKPGHPLNLNGMIALLSDVQTEDTKIIWSHFGGIGRFGGIPDNHYKNIDSLLKRFPQLMIDLSWSRVATKLDPDKVAAIINEYPDRFIMGSDALAPRDTSVLGQTYSVYDQPGGLFSKLTEEALEKLLEKNYDTVIRQGRENGKKFKQHILPGMTDLLLNPAIDNLLPEGLRAWMLNEYKEKDPDYYHTLMEEMLVRGLARKAAKTFIDENGPLISSSESSSSSPVVSTASRLRRTLAGISIAPITDRDVSSAAIAMPGTSRQTNVRIARTTASETPTGTPSKKPVWKF
ncbi:hypothetical protein [Actimicrobium antarcticum]|uniref:hypothetical protein n=1 Tax=Actimicrobium antarcticum TaxID=1051899 RepID=UPI0031E12922